MASADADAAQGVGIGWVAHMMHVADFLRLTHLAGGRRLLEVFDVDAVPAFMWHPWVGPFGVVGGDNFSFADIVGGRNSPCL